MNITFGDMAESLANLKKDNLFGYFTEQEILYNAIQLKKVRKTKKRYVEHKEQVQ